MNMALSKNKAPHQIDVVIVGAGFSGICAAINLKRAGISSFVVLEKADALGGVWRDNTYPGAACDIPSMLYSLSFELKPDWSRMFATQAEIQWYLHECADRHHILEHMLFGTEAQRCVFDETSQTWRVHTQSAEVFHTATIIMCVGQLNRPATPDIPGLDTFEGPAFHSSRWDHTTDLEGKSVAIVGSGASAIQIVPAIASRVRRLTVFQRSAPWILPKQDRPYSACEQWVFRHIPFFARLVRLRFYLRYERAQSRFKTGTKPNQQVAVLGKQFIESQVSDPQLQHMLLPDYVPGCKRILLSNDWYAAIARSNVNLVTTGIRHVGPREIETQDGALHATDVIILCTGFKSTDFLMPIDVIGCMGARLHDRWKDGAEAYKGATVPGFPNMFMVYGPNTTVAGSAVFMIECSVDYIVKLVKKAVKDGLVFEAREDMTRAYNAMLQKKAKAYSWTTGCRNWFVSATGKLINNWPASTTEFFFHTRFPSFRNYIVRKRPRSVSGR